MHCKTKIHIAQIQPFCDRRNIEFIAQIGTTFGVEHWNGPVACHVAIYLDPPAFKPEQYFDTTTPEYQEVDQVSHRLNRLLRHCVGRNGIIQGKEKDIQAYIAVKVDGSTLTKS